MPTKIEWAEETWNPVTGCTAVSEGCRNCYARRMAKRLAGRSGYPALDPFGVTLHHDKLDQPLHWKTPRRIFVVSMGDLFHRDVPDKYIELVWQTMYDARQHVFMVLTKRPERMLDWISRSMYLSNSPLQNVWLGTSVENQDTADERIPILLDTPASIRCVSVEPMLGPIDLRLLWGCKSCWPKACINAIHSDFPESMIDWIICGGESGPGARPMHPDWARDLRDQCQAANVPFLFKQQGAWSWDNTDPLSQIAQIAPDGWTHNGAGPCVYGRDHPGTVQVWRVGKKRAGRLIDGCEWNEYPETNDDRHPH